MSQDEIINIEKEKSNQPKSSKTFQITNLDKKLTKIGEGNIEINKNKINLTINSRTYNDLIYSNLSIKTHPTQQTIIYMTLTKGPKKPAFCGGHEKFIVNFETKDLLDEFLDDYEKCKSEKAPKSFTVKIVDSKLQHVAEDEIIVDDQSLSFQDSANEKSAITETKIAQHPSHVSILRATMESGKVILVDFQEEKQKNQFLNTFRHSFISQKKLRNSQSQLEFVSDENLPTQFQVDTTDRSFNATSSAVIIFTEDNMTLKTTNEVFEDLVNKNLHVQTNNEQPNCVKFIFTSKKKSFWKCSNLENFILKFPSQNDIQLFIRKKNLLLKPEEEKKQEEKQEEKKQDEKQQDEKQQDEKKQDEKKQDEKQQDEKQQDEKQQDEDNKSDTQDDN